MYWFTHYEIGHVGQNGIQTQMITYFLNLSQILLELLSRAVFQNIFHNHANVVIIKVEHKVDSIHWTLPFKRVIVMGIGITIPHIDKSGWSAFECRSVSSFLPFQFNLIIFDSLRKYFNLNLNSILVNYIRLTYPNWSIYL